MAGPYRERVEKRANTSKIRGQEQLDVAGLMNLLPLFHSTVLGLSVFSVQVKNLVPKNAGWWWCSSSQFPQKERDLGVGYSPGGPGVVCMCVREHCKSYRRHAVLQDSVFHRSSPLIRIKGRTGRPESGHHPHNYAVD